MNPSGPSATSTQVAPRALRPWKGTAVPQLDTVLVDPQSFQKLIYMGAAPRKAFTREQMSNADKPQKQTKAGVPLWSIKVAAENWRGRSEMINVTVPLHDDPASKFTTGQLVEFVRMVFGVTPKREGGGFTTWCSADAINAA